MKITIENTTLITTVLTDKGEVPARIWEGETSSGIKVQVLVTRIAAKDDQDLRQFEAELEEQKAPTFESCAFPLRMIL